MAGDIVVGAYPSTVLRVTTALAGVDGDLIVAVPGKRIRVLAFDVQYTADLGMSAGAAQGYLIKDGAAGPNFSVMSVQFVNAGAAGFGGETVARSNKPYVENGWFETSIGVSVYGLRFNIAGATSIDQSFTGTFVYILV